VTVSPKSGVLSSFVFRQYRIHIEIEKVISKHH